MIFTSIITANRQIVDERYKLLLLFQYMLPVFALVLGQLFENGLAEKRIIEKVFLIILIAIFVRVSGRTVPFSLSQPVFHISWTLWKWSPAVKP